LDYSLISILLVRRVSLVHAIHQIEKVAAQMREVLTFRQAEINL
jgi:hypothetical protein